MTWLTITLIALWGAVLVCWVLLEVISRQLVKVQHTLNLLYALRAAGNDTTARAAAMRTYLNQRL